MNDRCLRCLSVRERLSGNDKYLRNSPDDVISRLERCYCSRKQRSQKGRGQGRPWGLLTMYRVYRVGCKRWRKFCDFFSILLILDGNLSHDCPPPRPRKLPLPTWDPCTPETSTVALRRSTHAQSTNCVHHDFFAIFLWACGSWKWSRVMLGPWDAVSCHGTLRRDVICRRCYQIVNLESVVFPFSVAKKSESAWSRRAAENQMLCNPSTLNNSFPALNPCWVAFMTQSLTADQILL